jgi:hypothetical protein
MHYCRNEPKLAIHIYSWTIYKGDIPKDMFVCHTCDNTRCSNPAHLFLGSNKDNIKDMVSKKRHSFGSSHGCAKLNEQQVLQIRRLVSDGKTLSEVAKIYGVSQRTIHRIKHGLNWKCVI